MAGDHLESEQVVLLDDAGQVIGTAPKAVIHGPRTPLHLAFSCHIFDLDGRVLLTRRGLGKRAFPGVWTNACCGHPGPGEDVEAAVRRRVRQELGITLDTLRPVLPDYRYRAVDSSGVVENEICPVFVGTVTATDVRPDPEEVDDHRWCAWQDLELVAFRTPWLLSPWAAEQIGYLAPILADGD